MPRRVIYATLIFGAVSSIFVKNDATASESIEKHLIEDNKPFTAITRQKNSSRIAILSKSNRSAINYNNSFDKHPRTVNQRLVSDSKDKSSTTRKLYSFELFHNKNLNRASSSCCRSTYDSNSLRRPDSYYDRIHVNSNRHSTKFGERLPIDRYGWQTQGQPPGADGSAGRPATGNYAGSTFYERNHTEDRFIPRHNYGSESSRKPGNYDTGVFGGYGYGVGGHGGYGFTRPTGYGGGGGGYGISGTLANGDEVGPVELNYSEGNAPSHPNIQAQKAVALKALAGVALLGAAAALATNPVLLPLGVLSGRRKRSNFSTDDKDVYLDYISTILKNNATKYHDDETGIKVSLSPTCIARLICETWKKYVFKIGKNSGMSKRKRVLERRLTHPISSNVLAKDDTNIHVKKLIKGTTIVTSYRGNCDVFICTYTEDGKVKGPAVSKP